MQDKNGTEIKAGDTLFNPHDRDQYHAVLMGDDRKLYLGDFDSPLERYAPQLWWEVVPNAPHEGPGAASSRTVPLDAVVGRLVGTTE